MDADSIPARDPSWMLPLPERRAGLRFAHHYPAAEFERIKRGLRPEAMEDKWFIYYEEPWLYLLRSWTGACIYGVRFVSRGNGASAVEAWASRDSQHYTETRDDYDCEMLAVLIDALMLGKPAAFPTGGRSSKPPGPLYLHHIFGRKKAGRDDKPGSWRAGLKRLFRCKRDSRG